MARRRQVEGCDVDMTPMIDVVFQLIIFFIVTIKMDQTINEEIELAKARNAPIIEEEDPRTIIIEVDQRGWVSIQGAQLSHGKLARIMASRKERLGQFPVLIRGDRRTRHREMREVMDICTGIGIWRISFAAIQKEARR